MAPGHVCAQGTCAGGHHMEGNVCMLNECSCANGVARGVQQGDICPVHGGALCKQCDHNGWQGDNCDEPAYCACPNTFSGSTGSWFSPENWSRSHVPQYPESVTISSDVVLTESAFGVAHDLYIMDDLIIQQVEEGENVELMIGACKEGFQVVGE